MVGLVWLDFLAYKLFNYLIVGKQMDDVELYCVAMLETI